MLEAFGIVVVGIMLGVLVMQELWDEWESAVQFFKRVRRHSAKTAAYLTERHGGWRSKRSP